jgi:uncharacterized protein YprB with RNaseH-like and TPR domain
MLDRNVLDRLGELNRQSLPGSSRPRQVAPDAQSAQDTPRLLEPLPGKRLETCWGEHWLIEEPIHSLAPFCEREFPVARRQLAGLESNRETHAEVRHFTEAFPAKTIYLDLETCGLAGAMVFLAGVLHWRPEQGFVLTQLLARNYAEEKAILQSLWNLAQDKDVLVSFNGKSFDWPVVRDRSTLHHLGSESQPKSDGENFVRWPAEATDPDTTPSSGRIHPGLTRGDLRPQLVHFDLLHHSRRRWGAKLPNCRLQTLEYYICGRRRVGDIPGRMIPEAYHQFVRSGNPRQMHSILHHNALDLITLWQLSIRIPLPPKADVTAPKAG